MNGLDIANLTVEQLEVLRGVLAQHDQHKTENVFDLSKPPKVPYVYQEYDKMLYRADGHVIVVKNAQEEEEKKAEGYVNQPFPAFDYSRINRNGMKAAAWETEEEPDAELVAQAAHDIALAAKRTKKKA